jgi:hypothetical protein
VSESADTANQLRLLTAWLHESREPEEGDLSPVLDQLLESLRGAIPSFLGITMIIGTATGAMSLDVHPVRGASGTTLRIPLAELLTGSDRGSWMVFFAGRPGAFVDLAADFSYALGIDPTRILLDQDLTDGHWPVAPETLRDVSEVNRAIGFLIERGFLPEDAERELRRRSEASGITLPQAASRLLAGDSMV